MLILTAVVTPLNSNAKTAEERAGELVKWREQCNDPDPDLRLAYIESAIASGDELIQRTCTRLAVESDNTDIKNLGLRAVIASRKQITFTVELPKDIQNALNKAGNNKDEINKITKENMDIFKGYNSIRNGLTFIISESDLHSAQSVWHSLAMLSSKDDNYKGTTTITGNRLIWSGRSLIDSQDQTGSLALTLEPGGILTGFYQPKYGPLYPISAKLW